MGQSEIAVFQQSIETCEDPAETARKVKRTFKADAVVPDFLV